MRTSCIPHPRRGRFVVIHEWQMQFCDGDACAAALMGFFEWWHNLRLGAAEKAKQHNSTAETNGEPGDQDDSLIQFHTEEQFERGVLIYSRKAIRRAITLLEAKGAVEVVPNPNPKFKFDRKRYFIFHPEAAIRFLESFYPTDSDPDSGENGDVELAESRSGQSAVSSGQKASSRGQKASSIKEIELKEKRKETLSRVFFSQRENSDLTHRCAQPPASLESGKLFENAEAIPLNPDPDDERKTENGAAVVPRHGTTDVVDEHGNLIPGTLAGKFDAWWELYPRQRRKPSRAECYRRFSKIRGIEKPEVFSAVMIALTDDIEQEWARNLEAEEYQYIPHAMSWLGKKSWLDVLEDTKTNPTSQTQDGAP